MSYTWDEIKVLTNPRLKSFSPFYQDIAGVYLLQNRRGVKNHHILLNKTLFAKALYKIRHEWASMPDSPYGQPTHTVNELWGVYKRGL